MEVDRVEFGEEKPTGHVVLMGFPLPTLKAIDDEARKRGMTFLVFLAKAISEYIANHPVKSGGSGGG